MRRLTKLILSLLLAAALTLSAVPAGRAAETGSSTFSDVPTGAWYEQQLNKIIEAQQMVGQMNIISGYPDGTFGPNKQVLRGEFLKMIFEAAESSGNQTSLAVNKYQTAAHWAGKYYTKAEADNILIADVYTSSEPMFPCSWAALQEPITRFEMAVILNNVCTNISMQKAVIVDEPQAHITDYDEVESKTVQETDSNGIVVLNDDGNPVLRETNPNAIYRTAVEQSYGKGLLTGDENGYFHGTDTLTRAQAVSVLYRYLFYDTIKGEGLQDWASYPDSGKDGGSTDTPSTTGLLDPSLSFANWLRNGHIDAWGNLDPEARSKLFGAYANQGYFANSAQAAPYMANVSVPIWTIDRSNQWASSSVSITVNKAVAEEVRAIFQMIYNYGLEDDSRKFPIYGGWSAGGARYSDRMRHSWGCAIDVNALYNCECNFNSGYQRVTCGYGWWPADAPTWWNRDNSAYHGTLTGPSVYSISPDSIVVKAFATYGWGWLGNGFRSGNNFDFMHFSILPSGG